MKPIFQFVAPETRYTRALCVTLDHRHMSMTVMGDRDYGGPGSRFNEAHQFFWQWCFSVARFKPIPFPVGGLRMTPHTMTITRGTN